MKLLIKSYLLAQKQGKCEILLFSRKQYLTFASDRLIIFSDSLTKNQSLVYFGKSIMIA